MHSNLANSSPVAADAMELAYDGASRAPGSCSATTGGAWYSERSVAPRRAPSVRTVAASMLTAAYFMLRDETDYHDLGGRYLANRDTERVKQRLLRRLQDLGVVVEVKAA